MIKPYVWRLVFPARAGQQLSVFRHPATLLFSCPRPVRRNAEEVCAFVFMAVMYFPATSPFSVHIDISRKQVLSFRSKNKLLIVQGDSVDVIDDVFPMEVFQLQRVLRHGWPSLRSSDTHRAD